MCILCISWLCVHQLPNWIEFSVVCLAWVVYIMQGGHTWPPPITRTGTSITHICSVSVYCSFQSMHFGALIRSLSAVQLTQIDFRLPGCFYKHPCRCVTRCLLFIIHELILISPTIWPTSDRTKKRRVLLIVPPSISIVLLHSPIERFSVAPPPYITGVSFYAISETTMRKIARSEAYATWSLLTPRVFWVNSCFSVML